MLRRPPARVVLLPLQQLLHRNAVVDQDVAVVSLRSCGPTHPPDVGVGVLDARTLDGDPCGGRRQTRRVMGDELLAQVEAAMREHALQRLEGQRGHHWMPRYPGVSHLDDDGPVLLEEVTKR